MDGLPGVQVGNLTGQSRIPASVRGAQERGPFGKFQGDVALQRHRAGQIGALREMEQTALEQEMDRGLNGVGIIRHAVAHRAKVLHADAAGDLLRGEGKLLEAAVFITQLQGIVCTGAQGEHGEHIGIPGANRFAIQADGIALGCIVGRIVPQLKAGGDGGNGTNFNHVCSSFLSWEMASRKILRSRCFMPTNSMSKPM